MSFISVFDVLGPNMIGPSSSHTAGAASIAYLAYKMFGPDIVKAEFILYGSFAKTYRGHGTDRALLGGIMGFHTDDKRIPYSYEIAGERNLKFSFRIDDTETEVHPNTVDIIMTDVRGRKMTVRGESTGGGKIHITRIDQVEVDFTGEYSSLIVIHQDMPGVAAHITGCLSKNHINIAFLRLFRESKGKKAYSVVESDGFLPDEVKKEILQNPHIYEVMLIRSEREI
ncbi:MAG: L-serine ammonia-lyase, iron-sulfur-dependent subunit beta [Clostridiales bacterium]|nr:L-serine ammonia-lyase, iron-sulfur-dependent subunit beta [Clostridiales bacterium]